MENNYIWQRKFGQLQEHIFFQNKLTEIRGHFVFFPPTNSLDVVDDNWYYGNMVVIHPAKHPRDIWLAEWLQCKQRNWKLNKNGKSLLTCRLRSSVIRDIWIFFLPMAVTFLFLCVFVRKNEATATTTGLNSVVCYPMHTHMRARVINVSKMSFFSRKKNDRSGLRRFLVYQSPFSYFFNNTESAGRLFTSDIYFTYTKTRNVHTLINWTI